MTAALLQRPVPTAAAVHWRPASGGRVGGGTDPHPVFIAPKVLSALHAHWRATPQHGVLGFLVGDRCRDPNTGADYLVVDSTIRLNQAVYGDRVGVVVAKLWDRVTADVANIGGHLLGWYHSHPPAGVGLAPGDVETHVRHFTDPWPVALVLGAEATGPAAAFFRPGQDAVSATTRLSFYELAGPASGAARRSSLPWTNFVTDEAVTYRAQEAADAARAAAGDRSTLEVTGRGADAPAPAESAAPVPLRAPVAAVAARRPRGLADLPLLHDEPPPPAAPPAARRRPARPRSRPSERASKWRWPRRTLLAGLLLGATAAAAWRTGWLPVGPGVAPAVTDPTLLRFDRLGDSVAFSVSAYTELVPPFDSARIGCVELGQGLVTVEQRWIAYNVQGRAPLPALDVRRAGNDQTLYALVDAVDRHFAESGCGRP